MAIPTDGLIFYAPLAESKTTAETGQTMTEIMGEIPYINTDGVSYGIFDDKLLLIDPVTFPSTSFTMSIWYYRFKNAKTASFFSFGLHVTEEYGAIALRDEDGYLGFDRDGGGEASEYLFSGWTHCLLTYSQNTLKIYANGNLVYDDSLVLNIPSENQKLSIGGWFDIDTGYYTANGCISSARFYNRVLSESEISALANEFNEDSGGSDSGNTGFLIDGLFLSSSKPKLGQKGLLIDSKYFIPFMEVESRVAEYYKCSSVQQSSSTWTGYRAVLNDGIYTFEDTVTTGLSYTSVTPQVGKIYSQDALVYGVNLYQGIPVAGLVFYAPLAEDKAISETGQILKKNRELIFEYVQGFQCVFVPKGTGGVPGYSISPQPQLTSSQAQSISIWMKVANTWTTRDSDEAFATPLLAVVAAGGSYGNITKLRFQSEQKAFDCTETNFLEWHHYVMTFSPENIFKGYVDGILVVEQTSNILGTTNYPYTIGGGRNWGAYFAGARIYDRELNQNEVTSLYNEFTPTQE